MPLFPGGFTAQIAIIQDRLEDPVFRDGHILNIDEIGGNEVLVKPIFLDRVDEALVGDNPLVVIIAIPDEIAHDQRDKPPYHSQNHE